MHYLRAGTVGETGPRSLGRFAVWAVLILLGATANVRAQQPSSSAPPLQSSPAPAQSAASPPATAPAAPDQSLHRPAPRDANGKAYVLGESCVRRTDTKQGVVKRDACDRWYCGQADKKDVIEVLPNFAQDFSCSWRLEGDACKCRPAGYRPPANASSPVIPSPSGPKP